MRLIVYYLALLGALCISHGQLAMAAKAADNGVPAEPSFEAPPPGPAEEEPSQHVTPADHDTVQAPLPGQFLMEMSEQLAEKQKQEHKASASQARAHDLEQVDLSRVYEEAMRGGPSTPASPEGANFNEHARERRIHELTQPLPPSFLSLSEEVHSESSPPEQHIRLPSLPATHDDEEPSYHSRHRGHRHHDADRGYGDGFGLLEEQSSVRHGHQMRNRATDQPEFDNKPPVPGRNDPLRSPSGFNPADFSFLAHVGESVPSEHAPTDPLALMRMQQTAAQPSEGVNSEAQRMAEAAGLPGLPSSLPPMVPLPPTDSMPQALPSNSMNQPTPATDSPADGMRFRARAHSEVSNQQGEKQSAQEAGQWNAEGSQGAPPSSRFMGAPDLNNGPPMHNHGPEGMDMGGMGGMADMPDPQAGGGMPMMNSPPAAYPFTPGGGGGYLDSNQFNPAMYGGDAAANLPSSPQQPPVFDDQSLPPPPSDESLAGDLDDPAADVAASLSFIEKQPFIYRQSPQGAAPSFMTPTALLETQQQTNFPHGGGVFHPRAHAARMPASHLQRLKQKLVPAPPAVRAAMNALNQPSHKPPSLYHRMKEQESHGHQPVAPPTPRLQQKQHHSQHPQQHHPQPPPSHHARNLLYVQSPAAAAATPARARAGSFIQGRQRVRHPYMPAPVPAVSSYPPPPHHIRAPAPAVAMPSFNNMESPDISSPSSYLSLDEQQAQLMGPGPNPNPSNILDPSFWNRVNPLPVIAVEAAAATNAPAFPSSFPSTHPDMPSFLEMRPSSRPLYPHIPSMADLEAYDNYDRSDPLKPTWRDVAFSQAVRAQQHVEPILPDLPTPPVVLA